MSSVSVGAGCRAALGHGPDDAEQGLKPPGSDVACACRVPPGGHHHTGPMLPLFAAASRAGVSGTAKRPPGESTQANPARARPVIA